MWLSKNFIPNGPSFDIAEITKIAIPLATVNAKLHHIPDWVLRQMR